MVRGIVKGKVTIATALNKDIIMDRDLVYSSDSYDSTIADPQQRILSDGKDILALVSGGDLYLPFKPQADSPTGTIDICGVLYALGTDTYNPDGTYSKEGGIKFDKNRYKNQGIDCFIFYGSTCCRIMKQGAWSNGMGKSNNIHVYDTRLFDGLLPPAIPLVVTESGYLKLKDWGVWKAS
jgi:hypothetical protein